MSPNIKTQLQKIHNMKCNFFPNPEFGCDFLISGKTHFLDPVLLNFLNNYVECV